MPGPDPSTSSMSSHHTSSHNADSRTRIPAEAMEPTGKTPSTEGNQPSQAEDTQTGIFAGAEKYLVSDMEAPEKSREDLTNKGTAVVSGGKLNFVGTQTTQDGNSTGTDSVSSNQVGGPSHHSHSHAQPEKKVISAIDELPPLPDLSANVDDADFLTWLHQNNELHLDETTARNIDPAVRKRYEKYLIELEQRMRPQSIIQTGVPEMRPRSGSNVSASSGSGSITSEGKRRSKGPLRSLARVLHLDRSARRKEKQARKEEEARLMEELDMEQWKARLKKHHEKKLARQSTHRKSSTSDSTEDSDENTGISLNKDSAENSPSQKAPDALPMDLLNPEFLEKKNSEDELLRSGGDLASFTAKQDCEDSGETVSSERIKQLIESDHRKLELGEGPSTEDNLTADQFKVAFHTADSMDRLDRVNKTAPSNTNAAQSLRALRSKLSIDSRPAPFRSAPFRSAPFSSRAVPPRAIPPRTVPLCAVPSRSIPPRTVPLCAVSPRDVPKSPVPHGAVPLRL
ncbi:hypothetical protein BV898_09690 [Hypsibius exemplaris]|uniref:Uncharacterized protein n=1 Tax=Hypsibius exemplaris TaxID=2072580 RepID=A0A1W0WLX1_HYPEX|nr:hypothetical protein BV898_09690 [Hypsibius exemplaris]